MSTLRNALDEIVVDVPVYGDLDRAIEQAARDRRRRDRMVAGLVAAAAALAVVVSVLAVTRGGDDPQQPVGPPTERSSPTGWQPREPLRPPTGRVEEVSGVGDGWIWEAEQEVADVAVDETDIVAVTRVSRWWNLQLVARPPVDPADRVLAYGVVVDVDGDGEPDCQLGVSNDAPRAGDYSVWVTNLHTHATMVRDRPPYGLPVEFSWPWDQATGPPDPIIGLGFPGSRRTDPGTCDPFGEASTYYAWASTTEAGQVTARDYAPDDAWLPMRDE